MTIHLLNELFNPFTFNVIIDEAGFTSAFLLFVFYISRVFYSFICTLIFCSKQYLGSLTGHFCCLLSPVYGSYFPVSLYAS